MIAYCIKSILCLGLLWGFYKLFLEKENIHVLKRFYLIFSLVLALSIPLITFTYEKEVFVKESGTMIAYPKANLSPKEIQPIHPQSIESTSIDLPNFLWSFYILGVLIFGFRLVRNLKNICDQVNTYEKLREPSHINVLLDKNIIPHTFLHYIFLPKIEFQDQKIPDEILLHEKTHVQQKHTLDILFMELLQVAFWFNPIFILLKKAIRLNHEFLADQQVLKQQYSLQNYIKLLVTYPNSLNQAVLSSPINYSLTKKRLQMMTTHFSRKKATLKICALIPVITGCILLFNHQIVAKEVVKVLPNEWDMPNKEFDKDQKEDLIPVIEKRESKKRITSKTQIAKDIQDGISKEELKTYRQWIKNAKHQLKKGDGVRLKKEEVDQMEALYRAMSSIQREGVTNIEEVLPPPPPVPESPSGANNGMVPPPPPTVNGVKTPEAPQSPSVSKMNLMKIEEEANLEEIQSYRIEEHAIEEEIEREIAEAMQEAEEAQMEAMESEIEMALAVEQAQVSRQQAMEEARAGLEAGRQAAMAAREQAMFARKEAMKAGQDARREALKATHEIRRAHHLANDYSHVSTLDMIRKFAEKDTEFFYKGDNISSQKAMEIVRNAGNKLSIDVETKNGVSRAKIRD